MEGPPGNLRRPDDAVTGSQNLNLVIECGVRSDGQGAALAVCEFGRNDQLPPGSCRHELKGLVQSLQYPVHFHGGRLLALERVEEFGPVQKTHPVVALYSV